MFIIWEGYMKILARNLKKEEIALQKGYMKWYKVINNEELRFFINESKRDENGDLSNIIDWKNNIAYLCISSREYNEKFYANHKNLKARLFVKENDNSLYNELAVVDWYLSEKGIIVDLL
jgi:hypothetical protein